MFRRIWNTLISFLSFFKDFGDGIKSREGIMLRDRMIAWFWTKKGI
jgi:hypothetical protein